MGHRLNARGATLPVTLQARPPIPVLADAAAPPPASQEEITCRNDGRAPRAFVSGQAVSVRAGTTSTTAADVSRIESDLGWKASRDLTDIVATAWEAWRATH